MERLVRAAGGTSGSPTGLWVATEKVHGANFAFVCSPDWREVRPAKRSALLEPGDPFFGYRPAFAAAAPTVGALAVALAGGDPSVVLVTVFAELYGGSGGSATSSHGRGASAVGDGLEEEEEEKEDAAKPVSVVPEAVQTEITYRPSHGFYLFDAAVTRRRVGDSTGGPEGVHVYCVRDMRLSVRRSQACSWMHTPSACARHHLWYVCLRMHARWCACERRAGCPLCPCMCPSLAPVAQTYLDYLSLCAPFTAACAAAPDLLSWAAPLALGSLDEMCALPVDFKSPLSKVRLRLGCHCHTDPHPLPYTHNISHQSQPAATPTQNTGVSTTSESPLRCFPLSWLRIPFHSWMCGL